MSAATDAAGSYGLVVQGGSDVTIKGFNAASKSRTDIALQGGMAYITIKNCESVLVSHAT